MINDTRSRNISNNFWILLYASASNVNQHCLERNPSGVGAPIGCRGQMRLARGVSVGVHAGPVSKPRIADPQGIRKELWF
jgi:hypothetical protein